MNNISIVIPTIHQCDDLLNALIRDLPGSCEIIVEAGGSFADNCNKGAAQATGDILLFLNDDCEIVTNDWLEPLVDPIIRDPQVAVTGARLVYPSGLIQHAGVYLFGDGQALHGRNVCWNAASGPVQAVTGACMAVERAVFEALGGFDATYVNGNEDIDFCLRVGQTGRIILYCAEATLMHHESQSGDARWAHVQDNVALLTERWLGRTENNAGPG